MILMAHLVGDNEFYCRSVINKKTRLYSNKTHAQTCVFLHKYITVHYPLYRWYSVGMEICEKKSHVWEWTFTKWAVSVSGIQGQESIFILFTLPT